MNKRAGLIVVGSIFGIGLILLSAICWHYKLNMSFIRNPPNAGDLTYIKPYCRLMPYYIGILLYMLYSEGKDVKAGSSIPKYIHELVYNSYFVRYSLYVGGIAITVYTCYLCYFMDAYPDDWGVNLDTTYMIVSRPIVTIALCMVLYPVLIGRGKALLAVSGHPFFNVLGKLTYGTYMLHIIFMQGNVTSHLQSHYYDLLDVFTHGIAVTCLSYVASFVVTIFIESPVVQLLKTFLEVKKGRTSAEGKTNTNVNATANTTSDINKLSKPSAK